MKTRRFRIAVSNKTTSWYHKDGELYTLEEANSEISKHLYGKGYTLRITDEYIKKSLRN